MPMILAGASTSMDAGRLTRLKPSDNSNPQTCLNRCLSGDVYGRGRLVIAQAGFMHSASPRLPRLSGGATGRMRSDALALIGQPVHRGALRHRRRIAQGSTVWGLLTQGTPRPIARNSSTQVVGLGGLLADPKPTDLGNWTLYLALNQTMTESPWRARPFARAAEANSKTQTSKEWKPQMTEQTGAVTLSPNLSFMHDTMISLYRALIKAGKEEPYDPARFNDAHFHFNGAAQAYCAGIVDEAEHAKLSDGKRK